MTVARRWTTVALLLVTCAAPLLPVFRNGFVYDDRSIIGSGDYLHDWTRAPEFFVHPTMYVSPVQRDLERHVDTYRPVTLVTFLWDSSLSGRAPFSYHLTNLLAHLLCVLLVLRLAEELLAPERRKYAPLAALWFGLSPIPAEAHVWINGRSDVFCCLFGVATLLAWRRAIASSPGRHRVAWHLAAAALFLAGLLSKEVLLPALVAVLAWPGAQGEPGWRTRLKNATGMFVAAGVYLALRVHALHGMRTYESGLQVGRAALQLGALWLDGFVSAVVPQRTHLRMMRDEYARLGDGWLLALAALAVVLGVVLVLQRKRWPLGTWGALWFATTLAPVAVISTMVWPGFGRYLYVPMVGLSIALADAVGRLLEWRPALARVVRLAGVLYFALLAFQLVVVVRSYESPDTLYGAVIVADPSAAHGPGWLGMSRAADGEYEQAIPFLAAAVERDPAHAAYSTQLADALLRTGRPEPALEVATQGLARAVEEPGQRVGELHMVAINVLHARDPRAAAVHMLDCLRADPGHVACGDALRNALTRHPLRDRYRVAVREILRAPAYAGVARQVRPLLDSLP
jgi:tetratricopeptide (TPR) repeat protein